MPIDTQGLLKPLSAEASCGIDIGYDPLFLELDVLIRGKPEIQMGTEVRPAEEPDWKDIRERCLELFSRSKHLRVALYLTAASLRLEGLTGLRDGLGLLRGLLEQYWDDVHPKLDPEDGNDPTERMNIIGALAPPPSTDEFLRFKDRVLDAPVCAAKQLGRLSLRQIMWASGELVAPEPEQSKVPQAALIQATFDEMGLDATQALEAVAKACVDHLKAIDTTVTQRVGSGVAPNLDSFVKVVGRAHAELQRQVGRMGGQPIDVAAPSGDAPAPAAGAVRPAAGGEVGSIASPQDVLRAIDRICDYYARAEPSSPVPLLLKRAKRLVGKNFTQIIKDLSPEALRQIESISGTPADTAESGAAST